MLTIAAPAQGGERVALEEHFFYGREEVAHMLTNTPLSVIDIAVWWMRSTWHRATLSLSLIHI